MGCLASKCCLNVTVTIPSLSAQVHVRSGSLERRDGEVERTVISYAKHTLPIPHSPSALFLIAALREERSECERLTLHLNLCTLFLSALRVLLPPAALSANAFALILPRSHLISVGPREEERGEGVHTEIVPSGVHEPGGKRLGSAGTRWGRGWV